MKMAGANQELNQSVHEASGPGRGWSSRRRREWQTLVAMVRCYCRGRHGRASGLCAECQGLLDYAAVRLERCRFGEQKPTCAKCPVHCYQREHREQVRQVMRFAGPRMLWEHPLLTLLHWRDSLCSRHCTGGARSR